jgi:hypothetical protein
VELHVQNKVAAGALVLCRVNRVVQFDAPSPIQKILSPMQQDKQEWSCVTAGPADHQHLSADKAQMYETRKHALNELLAPRPALQAAFKSEQKLTDMWYARCV